MAADARTLAFLHELERADETVGAVLAELDELAAEVERIQARVGELRSFLADLPDECERVAEALTAGVRAVADQRQAVDHGKRELEAAERAKGRDRLAAARRDLVRVRDALHTAERKAAELQERREELERCGAEAEAEASRVEVRAQELAAVLAERPRLAGDAGVEPGPGLAGVAEWSSRARAALFVARGGLVAERDAVVRQANELGALVLGEPLSAASPGAVARRVEQASS